MILIALASSKCLGESAHVGRLSLPFVARIFFIHVQKIDGDEDSDLFSLSSLKDTFKEGF